MWVPPSLFLFKKSQLDTICKSHSIAFAFCSSFYLLPVPFYLLKNKNKKYFQQKSNLTYFIFILVFSYSTMRKAQKSKNLISYSRIYTSMLYFVSFSCILYLPEIVNKDYHSIFVCVTQWKNKIKTFHAFF